MFESSFSRSSDLRCNTTTLSVLLLRLRRTLSVPEFVELARSLEVDERYCLLNRCVSTFLDSGARIYAEAADGVAKSLGFTTYDCCQAWFELIWTREAVVAEELAFTYPSDALCLKDRCIAEFKSTGDEFFLDVAQLISFSLGWPSIDDCDWGEYRDGEDGPSCD